jgi:hypothetical protein
MQRANNKIAAAFVLGLAGSFMLIKGFAYIIWSYRFSYLAR